MLVWIKNDISRRVIVLILSIMILVSITLHFSIFKLDLIGYHVWRQTETQTVINNFVNGDGTLLEPKINDLDLYDGKHIREFPLMQWLFAKACSLNGDAVLTSRVLSYLIHIFSTLGIYSLCVLLFGRRVLGMLGCWLFLFSPVMYYYAVNPLPDNMALCLAIWSGYFTIRWWQNNKWFFLLLAFFAISMSILVKLPFMVMGGSLFYLVCIKLRYHFKQHVISVLFFSCFLVFPLIWYMYSIPYWHGVGAAKGVFSGGFNFSDSLDIIQHNLISTLPELYVNYAALPLFGLGIYFLIKYRPKSVLYRAFFFQTTLVAIFFLFEHNMIGKVHDYYLFPISLSIILLMIYGLKNSMFIQRTWIKPIVYVGIFIMPLTCFLRSQSRWNEKNPGLNVTLYTEHGQMQEQIPSKAKCIVGEDESRFIWLYYLNRKGWSFGQNGLTEQNFKKWYNKGASYLIADKPVFELSYVKPYLHQLVFKKGDIIIYQLK